MGEYFSILCHTCRKQHCPSMTKAREIFLNQHVAAEVGRFAVEHAGHAIELRGDECNYLPEYPKSCLTKYQQTTAREAKCLREGIEE